MGTTGLSKAVRIGAALLGALALGGGLLAALAGAPGGALWLLLVGCVLLLTALYEKARYGSSERAPPEDGGGRLKRTEELFHDPTTGALTRVWYDPVTGERRYLPER